MKKLLTILLLVCALLAPFVSAQSEQIGVEVTKIEVNDNPVSIDGTNLNVDLGDVKRGEKVEVKVWFTAQEDVEDVEIEAGIDGSEEDSEDETEKFDIKADKSYVKKLEFEVPSKSRTTDTYTLKVYFKAKQRSPLVLSGDMDTTTSRRALKIKDTVFIPGERVQAGKSLSTVIRLENYGDRDEDNVKVKVSIPELGVSDYDFLDTVEEGDSLSTKQLYMMIPKSAEAREYTMMIEVESDYESVSEETTVTVIGSASQDVSDIQGNLVITVPSQFQEVSAGKSVTYTMLLTNNAETTKTYVLTANNIEWASVQLSNNVVVLDSKESKMVNVYVAPDSDTTEGVGEIVIGVASDSEKLQDVSLKAYVKAPVEKTIGGTSTVKILEVSLIVLVIILVLLLVIVGLTRMKRKDDDREDEDDDENYY